MGSKTRYCPIYTQQPTTTEVSFYFSQHHAQPSINLHTTSLISYITTLALLVPVIACDFQRPQAHTRRADTDHPAVKYTREASHDWATLAPAYSACGDGMTQSSLAIPARTVFPPRTHRMCRA